MDLEVLEHIAVITGIIGIWFSVKENILVFPMGIVSVLIFVYITFFSKLYAGMFVNAYYFVMNVYGWYNWYNPKAQNHQIPIGTNSLYHNLVAIFLTMLFCIIIRYILIQTDTDVPNWDAISTAFAFTAMWLMAKKRIEHWIFWILSDAIALPLYFHKGLYFTSFQFLVFIIFAIWGYFSWRKKLFALSTTI